MNSNNPTFLRPRERGISLIIVLILMVVIGLTSAAAMRGATSGQRLTNNVRTDNVAQQYSEAALRYCETELQRPDPALPATQARPNSLLRAVIPVTVMGGGVQGVWENPVAWTGTAGVGPAITRTTLNQAQYTTAGLSSYLPAKAPECVAEVQTLGVGPGAFNVTVVTSRGFSSDYRADGAGNTIQGSVVWLQSILNMCAAALPCP